MSENSSSFSWKGFAYAVGHSAWALISVMAISGLVLILVLRLLVGSFGLNVETITQPEWTLGLYASQYALGLFILLLLPVVIQKRTREQLVKLFGLARPLIASDIGIAFVGYIPYLVTSVAVQAIIIALIPGFDATQAQDVGFSDLQGGVQLMIAFVALVVLAPLAEELVFRGYVYGSAREKLGFWPAAIITSAVFGFVHGQWNVAIDTFILSMVLCYLRERTGAIWASVFLHAIKNGLAFFLLFVAPGMGLDLVQ